MENEGKAWPELVRTRLMPAVEDTQGPLGYGCFGISRGIKKKICKERVRGKINVWLPCEEHKKEISHGGITSIFFLLHLKIHREFGLLLCIAGTMLAWQNPRDGKVCGAFVVSQSELVCPELPYCGALTWRAGPSR